MNRRPGRTYLRESRVIRSDIYKFLLQHESATTQELIRALHDRNPMTIKSKLSAMVAEGAVIKHAGYYPPRYYAGKLPSELPVWETVGQHAGTNQNGGTVATYESVGV